MEFTNTELKAMEDATTKAEELFAAELEDLRHTFSSGGSALVLIG